MKWILNLKLNLNVSETRMEYIIIKGSMCETKFCYFNGDVDGEERDYWELQPLFGTQSSLFPLTFITLLHGGVG